ncbi:uncharacterized protein LOC106637713 [Copidosoma floridanum]|uniref:uncharacterized protein LOC106637713 n=1 Tax=Copidosoma floridanum TaxID=29053 RepID=UPI0006C98ED3|nr:uncharacterized protein LOC106637713 [Copidosoma floridanum]
MAIARLVLLIVAAAASIEAKAIGSKPPSEETQLFFTHNGTLVRMAVRDGHARKAVVVGEEVTDYALDEVRDRIFWVAKNGSVFVRPIGGSSSASQPVFASPSLGAGVRIACDWRTDKLYLTSHEGRSVMALDLKNTGPYHRWHVVLEHGHLAKVQRISLDPAMGAMFVQLDDGNWTDLYRYNMDGTDRHLVMRKESPQHYDYDFETKKLHHNSGEIAADGNQFYLKYHTDDRSYKVIRAYGPKRGREVLAFLDAFDTDDVRNLRVYRRSVKKYVLVDPCENNGECGTDAMCLLKITWPGKSCNPYSKAETRSRIARQIPFDMYSQQPTLRPEPQPTQPDNSYLPVYLSIIG